MTQNEREELLERVNKAEAIAQECRIVAAVYREHIKDAVELAGRAVRENRPDFLNGALGHVEYALDEKKVRDWAKSWRKAWSADITWLQKSLGALKKIQSLAKRIDAPDSTDNAALKLQIIAATKLPLVQHALASISLDDAIESEADFESEEIDE